MLQIVLLTTGNGCGYALVTAVDCDRVRAKCLIFLGLREDASASERWDCIENPRVGGSIPPQATKDS